MAEEPLGPGCGNEPVDFGRRRNDAENLLDTSIGKRRRGYQ